MRGLPDWGRPVDRDGARLFAAYEQDGVLIALPDTLTIASDGAGHPSFRLTAIRPLVPMPGRRGHGRLDMELRLDSAAATDDGAVRAAPPLRGWLWLRSEMLDLPDTLDAPVELDCSGLGLARLTLPLAAEGVAMIEAALEDGTTPILAHVEFEVAGIAPRLPLRAIVDLARLRAALNDGAMTPGRLTEALAIDPGKVGVTIEGASDDHDVREMAAAVADHIRARLCEGPLMPAGENGLALFPVDGGIATGTATLDLSSPIVATRSISVALDPFASARTLGEAMGGIPALITRGQSGMLPTGRHEVIVDASVSRPCVGPLALGATLGFPPRPPARMHAVIEDFELPASGDGVARQVRLAPGEPLAWTLSGFAFWPTADGRGAQRLDGAAVEGAGTRALLRPDAFPLIFVDVESGPTLLAIASVEVAVSGDRQDGTPARTATTLTADMPRATLALPIDVGSPMLSGTLAARDGCGRIDLPACPAIDRRFELADVPGYGARTMELAVTLPDGVPLAAVDVLAEDAPSDAEPETYAFTSATRTRTHRWLCRDPFRPGLRWRWRGQGEFSAPVVAPRMDLVAEVLPA